MNDPRILVLAAALSCSLPAFANRPLTTETADVVEDGVFQLEAYAARVTASGTPDVSGWTAQLTRGIGHHTQLSAALGRAHGGGESASELLLGGKSWLIELGEDTPGASVAYGLTSVKLPGDSWRHDGTYVTLVGTQPFGKSLLVHANLGWARSAIAKLNSTTWAIGLEVSTDAKVNLIAETYGDDRGKPTVAVGALWQVLPKFSVSTSYGVTRASPRIIKELTLGFQFDF